MVDPGAHVVGQAGDIGPGGVLAVGPFAAAALAAALGVRVHCAGQYLVDGATSDTVDGTRCHVRMLDSQATCLCRQEVTGNRQKGFGTRVSS